VHNDFAAPVFHGFAASSESVHVKWNLYVQIHMASTRLLCNSWDRESILRLILFKEIVVKLNLATGSLFLFGVAIFLWLLLTLFESALVGMSLQGERLITLLGLVLPAAIGAAMGLISLIRKEGRAGLAIVGVLLNTLFALLHLMIVLFAG
jgi:hypothetical protein